MDTFLPIITQLEDKKLADTLVEIAKDKDRLDVVFLGFNAEQVFDILGYNVHPWCCALVLAVAGKDLVHDSNRTKMKTQEGAGDALSLNQPTPPPPQEPSGKLSAAEFFKYACAFLESTDLNLLGPVHTFVGVIARALGDAALLEPGKTRGVDVDLRAVRKCDLVLRGRLLTRIETSMRGAFNHQCAGGRGEHWLWVWSSSSRRPSSPIHYPCRWAALHPS